MRISALILASLLVACGAPPAVTAPATVSAEKPVSILASEGGVLRPITNGGRVALKQGWATVAVSPSSVGECELDVAVFGLDGKLVPADVTVAYESMDMDHGMTKEHGEMRSGHYQMHLTFEMPGAWRLFVHIARGGVEEIVTLVLPQAGL